MIHELIYRKNFDQNLLRCVTYDEAQRILHKFHYGFFGGNYSGPTTIAKVLEVGYYWLTIFQYSFKIAREYEKCSRYMGKRR